MLRSHPITHATTCPAPPARAAAAALKFQRRDALRQALQRRVNAYFDEGGRTPRDCPAMYAKSAILLATLVAIYLALLLAPLSWPSAIGLTLLLGLALAAVSFNVQHDGGHGAYSRFRWVNKAAALMMDLLGGSSYVWARTHNKVHHSYTNVTGHDDDINVGPLGRLTPYQPRLAVHRWQHLYLWLLYGMIAIKWHIYDDFRDVVRGRVGDHRLPRPRGWDLATFLGGKATFFTLAWGVPLLLHPWWLVLPAYLAASYVQGLVLGVVFQLAHCHEEAEFPMPSGPGDAMATGWAEHQLQTTANFAPHNRVLTWFVGGLNHQVEHHLFPHVCHIHYPALATIVQQTCDEFGVAYRAHPTLRSAIASHYRWLRRMGRAA